MKTRLSLTQPLHISTSRWLAYAAAGAATALPGATSVDGEIHYSGRVDVSFAPDENKGASFSLGEPGAFIRFIHSIGRAYTAFFEINGLQSNAFKGYYVGFEYAYPAQLPHKNRYISQGDNFVRFYDIGTLYADRGRGYGAWGGKSAGFVGFRFNNGAGVQYGWARLRMYGDRASFLLLDFAYGDPGEPIRPGQTSSSAGNDVAEEGSIGLLAVGAAGLALWRKQRKSFIR